MPSSLELEPQITSDEHVAVSLCYKHGLHFLSNYTPKRGGDEVMSGEVGPGTMEKEKWVADDFVFLQLPTTTALL